MVGAMLIHFGLLLVLKYSGFFFENVNAVLSLVHLNVQFRIPHYMLPIGISFYTMMAASYLIDVYRGLIQPDRNIWRLALYISFFPTLMEGPICRYQDTADQIFACNKVTYENLTFGAQRIVWGLFKKVIVADRLNSLILKVFSHYSSYDGTVMFVAMVCYTIQLYMEFSGTIDAVIGIGEIFGVKIPENFRQPFFANSISDFWARWHITLGTWFRDYIYYPISMSGPMKKLTSAGRKKLGNYYGPMLASTVALFAVWLCNGIWHGDAWTYIFFGLYHFSLLFLGRLLEPAFAFVTGKLHLSRESKGYHVFQVIRTVLLVFVGELFFRAISLKAGFSMLGKMFTDFRLSAFTDGTLVSLGVDGKDYVITLIVLLIVLAVGVLKERGVKIREAIAAQKLPVRWTVYYMLLLAIVIFGGYGFGYTGIDPIYAGF